MCPGPPGPIEGVNSKLPLSVRPSLAGLAPAPDDWPVNCCPLASHCSTAKIGLAYIREVANILTCAVISGWW